jgi:hypothetical protein
VPVSGKKQGKQSYGFASMVFSFPLTMQKMDSVRSGKIPGAKITIADKIHLWVKKFS